MTANAPVVPLARFIALAVFLGSICSQTLHVHQAAFFVDHGLPAMTAASVVVAASVEAVVEWLFFEEVVIVVSLVGMEIEGGRAPAVERIFPS